MGYLRPTAVIVTGMFEDRESGWHWTDVARAKALELFDRPFGPASEFDMRTLVSPVSGLVWNNVRSFAVFWDGSNEGWAPSDAVDAARAEFVRWLGEQRYEDGSSPLRWVEVAYTDDDGRTMVLATSADLQNARQAMENKIVLEIEEPEKSALEWAELDGITIVDPDGWREPLEELPAQDLEVPIGRGEFERRLAVSSVVSVRGGS